MLLLIDVSKTCQAKYREGRSTFKGNIVKYISCIKYQRTVHVPDLRFVPFLSLVPDFNHRSTVIYAACCPFRL